MGDPKVCLIIHHGGSFRGVTYVGSSAYIAEREFDLDKLSYPNLVAYVKEDLGYDKIAAIKHRKGKGEEFDVVFNDQHCLKIAESMSKGGTLEFFVEHENECGGGDTGDYVGIFPEYLEPTESTENEVTNDVSVNMHGDEVCFDDNYLDDLPE